MQLRRKAKQQRVDLEPAESKPPADGVDGHFDFLSRTGAGAQFAAQPILGRNSVIARCVLKGCAQEAIDFLVEDGYAPQTSLLLDRMGTAKSLDCQAQNPVEAQQVIAQLGGAVRVRRKPLRLGCFQNAVHPFT